MNIIATASGDPCNRDLSVHFDKSILLTESLFRDCLFEQRLKRLAERFLKKLRRLSTVAGRLDVSSPRESYRPWGHGRCYGVLSSRAWQYKGFWCLVVLRRLIERAELFLVPYERCRGECAGF